MQGQVLARKLKSLPDAPGVYFFLGRNRRILYIGRATSLRNRVRSYFAPDVAENPSTSLRARRGPWIEKMVREARSVDFKKTDSVLEAILLEADLIKKFKPPYNTDLKDDKSFNCVVITRESFPVVFVARFRDVDFSLLRIKPARRPARRLADGLAGGDKGLRILSVYGPYPAGFHLQTAMKIIRKIFPFRDPKCTPCGNQMSAQRGHLISTEDCPPCFSRQIGLCPGVCTGAISRREYAKTIRNLRLFFEGKKARLLKLLEREMKAAAKRQEFEKAGEMKRQLFALKHIQDIALMRRDSIPPFLKHARRLAGGEVPDRAEDLNNPLAPFVKGDKSLPLTGTPFKKGRIRSSDFRIEAYDISHFGGKGIVGAMAVAEDGVARPSEYRLFKIRGSAKQNDSAGLQEIIRRRLAHREWRFPNLIVVDGNNIQKRAAEDTIRFTGFSIPVVAVVKDERHKPREIIGFHRHSNILKNVGMSWRDDMERVILLANAEAHRFALTFQKKQRK